MTPTDIKPSPRLVRAAHAEREELRRRREQLAEARDETVASLNEIERVLAGINERELLLTQLAPSSTERDDRESDEPARNSEADPSKSLRGPAIREAAVRLLAQSHRAEALHYRDWFALLTREGFAVAGKDPLAVFLTQLSRSPAVRKSTQTGVYELDRQAPRRLTHELERLHGELRELTSDPSDTTDLSSVRARRERLTSSISRIERALDEARRVLGPPSTGDGDVAEQLAATA
jgi:hypothetical protein